ncbi:MAG: hypothetical protein VXZ39_07980 [Planctomycetota bacterium]|nr:hypothetical protein [Planctomycetota bacterium]
MAYTTDDPRSSPTTLFLVRITFLFLLGGEPRSSGIGPGGLLGTIDSGPARG